VRRRAHNAVSVLFRESVGTAKCPKGVLLVLAYQMRRETATQFVRDLDCDRRGADVRDGGGRMIL